MIDWGKGEYGRLDSTAPQVDVRERHCPNTAYANVMRHIHPTVMFILI